MSVPFTPLDVRPLHGEACLPGQYWACEYPERPVVPHVSRIDLRCRSCALAAWAHILETGSRMENLAFGAAGSGVRSVDIGDRTREALRELHGVSV